MKSPLFTGVYTVSPIFKISFWILTFPDLCVVLFNSLLVQCTHGKSGCINMTEQWFYKSLFPHSFDRNSLNNGWETKLLFKAHLKANKSFWSLSTLPVAQLWVWRGKVCVCVMRINQEAKRFENSWFCWVESNPTLLLANVPGKNLERNQCGVARGKEDIFSLSILLCSEGLELHWPFSVGWEAELSMFEKVHFCW